MPQPRQDQIEIHRTGEQAPVANLEREAIEAVRNKYPLDPLLRQGRDRVRRKAGQIEVGIAGECTGRPDDEHGRIDRRIEQDPRMTRRAPTILRKSEAPKS